MFLLILIIPAVLIGYVLLQTASLLIAALFWVLCALMVCAIVVLGVGYMMAEACRNGDDVQQ